MFIERDDFAVENCFFGLELFAHVNQLGILRRHLDLIARKKLRLAVAHEADRSKAVPLGFKNPIRIGKGIVNERGQHRMDDRGHARLAG